MWGKIAKAVVGLFAVSAGYTWTVGQSSLDTTNKNLCELVNSLSPVTFDGCRVQEWIAYVWMALGVVATGYLIFLGFRLIVRQERAEARLRMLWVLGAALLLALMVVFGLLVREARMAGGPRTEDAAKIASLETALASETAKKAASIAPVQRPEDAAQIASLQTQLARAQAPITPPAPLSAEVQAARKVARALQLKQNLETIEERRLRIVRTWQARLEEIKNPPVYNPMMVRRGLPFDWGMNWRKELKAMEEHIAAVYPDRLVDLQHNPQLTNPFEKAPSDEDVKDDAARYEYRKLWHNYVNVVQNPISETIERMKGEYASLLREIGNLPAKALIEEDPNK